MATTTTLTVNENQPTGGIVPIDVFGSAVGQTNNFAFMANPAWQSAARSLNLPLLRTNSNIVGNVFANGLGHPNWAMLDNLVNNLGSWFSGKLILGIGAPPSGVSTTTYGQMVAAVINHAEAAGITPYGIETYNEPDGRVSASTVGKYTLAAANAAQAVTPSIKIFAGVTSYDNVSYLRTVLSSLGNTPNVVVDYHEYSSGNTTTSDATLMSHALNQYGNAVNNIHNNLSASDPQLIGEYNMSYDFQPTDPRQATAEGGVNAALSMSTAASAGLQMGAIWELYDDQTFGLISDTSGSLVVRPDAYTLSEMAKAMPGQIVSSSLGSGASNLYTLSTTSGTEIVNYGTSGDYTVNVSGLGSSTTEWLMNAANPAGTTIPSPNLSAVSVPAMSVVILANGGSSPSPSPSPSPSSSPPSAQTADDTLVLNLSEDAWNGDAQFTAGVDGKQIIGPTAVTAAHAAGQSQTITQVLDGLANGVHDLTVSFINDAWGGTSSTDRNLYLNSAQIDGGVSLGSHAFWGNDTQHFSFTVAH